MFFMKWYTNLIRNGTGYSAKNWFLFWVTIIGLALLTVPIIALLIEVWHNHTISTDLNGMAAYIGSVAAVFASVGVTKAISEKYENKNPNDESSDS